MDSVPFEILLMIAGHVRDSSVRYDRTSMNLVPYAPTTIWLDSLVPFTTVNTKWQAAFEPYIWEDIHILSHSTRRNVELDDVWKCGKKGLPLAQLDKLTSGSQMRHARRKALRAIHYKIAMPHWLVEGMSMGVRFESYSSVRAESDVAFTYGVLSLFDFLARRQKRSRPLRIDIVLQTEHLYRRDLLPEAGSLPLRPGRLSQPYIASLVPATRLPQITCIDALEFSNATVPSYHEFENAISTSSALKIAAACPSLRSLGLPLPRCIPEHHYAYHRSVRLAAAANLATLPTSVRTMTLSSNYMVEPWHEDPPWQDPRPLLTTLPPRLDSLTVALHHVSVSLRRLQLTRIEFDPRVWSIDSSESICKPYWPHLEILAISDAAYRTPDNSPLLAGNDLQSPLYQPPHATSSLEERPDPPVPIRSPYAVHYGYFDMLFESLSQAVRRMPRLSILDFRFEGEQDRLSYWMTVSKSFSFQFRSDHGYAPTWRILGLWGVEKQPLKFLPTLDGSSGLQYAVAEPLQPMRLDKTRWKQN